MKRKSIHWLLLAVVVVFAGCSFDEDDYRNRISPTVPDDYVEVSLGILKTVAEDLSLSTVFDTPTYNAHYSQSDDTLVLTFKHRSSYSRERSREYMLEDLRNVYRPIVFRELGRAATSPDFKTPRHVAINVHFRTHTIGPVPQRENECLWGPGGTRECKEVIVTRSGPVDYWDHTYTSLYLVSLEDNTVSLYIENIRDI